jgi:mRNA interferase RelE/StbE
VYRVEIQRKALKELRRIDRQDQKRILKVIDGLAEDPRPAGSKKLTDTEDWRIRVGSYRIVYRIQEQRLLVLVVRIAHRSDVYRRG